MLLHSRHADGLIGESHRDAAESLSGRALVSRLALDVGQLLSEERAPVTVGSAH
ncbi:hypothetical protein KILIM_078_00060 [Kineosphaera limosa NBRC 100340]|uniref:Uncharacterized protein n=1 Tax=Kineosphaera limosa NBRC 100340 TaxID=1184609 RepID=K6XFQ5_9MICO|nr:hypothetical protein KILIM_078_00060 [Kineosphaera limosa NBRC 100340]